MGRESVIVEIDLDDSAREVREYGPPSDDFVIALLRELSAGEHATMTIRPSDRDSYLIVALDERNVFIGRDGPDGIFEYAGSPDREGTVAMRIAGRETTLEPRFVVSVYTARDCIQGLLKRGDASIPINDDDVAIDDATRPTMGLPRPIRILRAPERGTGPQGPPWPFDDDAKTSRSLTRGLLRP